MSTEEHRPRRSPGTFIYRRGNSRCEAPSSASEAQSSMNRSLFRGLLTLFIIAFVIIQTPAFCETRPTPTSSNNEQNEPDPPSQAVSESTEKDFWETLKGNRARDALLLGMWSLHLDGTGEYFGDGRRNTLRPPEAQYRSPNARRTPPGEASSNGLDRSNYPLPSARGMVSL